MSVQASAWVWENSQHKGTTLLVFLAIADHMNKEMDGAWTSGTSIAEQCRISLRAVQYALRILERSGELRVSYKTGPHGCNVYGVNLGTMQSLHDPEEAETVQPDVGDSANQRTETVQPVAPEPSLAVQEPSEGQSTSPAALNELVENLVQGWREPRPQRGGDWLPSPPGISDTQAAYVRKLGGQDEWWPAIHKAKRRHADIVVSLALSHLSENGMTIQNPFARLEAECGIVETEYLPAVSVAVEEGEWATTPTR